ncbi:DsbA family oxidoreductase [Mucilaginibacter gossypii]|uniref:Predicted dithiol-disulfide isomerase, DsbA family n=1 Tax=Mucilaginibacter gossypii TaxID=551996 RepID=A0A1G8CQL6_9SPHI|nr:DsbA family oxidoreductase [Mucilaginibacter gossypii]SDH47748.1 Predicted dithiol-disulfide isomerase, DsbA family [Mucilaginibacter gossypii]
MKDKMVIEIWSDLICPFCYIGKRKLEAALNKFPQREKIKLIWKSYQLIPDLDTRPGRNLNEFMAAHKGMSIAQARAMNTHVSDIAKQNGLNYDLDHAIIANTFNAHRLLHFAKAYDKQDEAEEILFKSYFTDGKNIDDHLTLIQLGAEIGLDASKLKPALESDAYANEVRQDIEEAHQIGVRGVPYFLVDRKQAISGAQPEEVFDQVLSKAFEDWTTRTETITIVNEGPSCGPDSEC